MPEKEATFDNRNIIYEFDESTPYREGDSFLFDWDLSINGVFITL